jgi:hypothetical protein
VVWAAAIVGVGQMLVAASRLAYPYARDRVIVGSGALRRLSTPAQVPALVLSGLIAGSTICVEYC